MTPEQLDAADRADAEHDEQPLRRSPPAAFGPLFDRAAEARRHLDPDAERDRLADLEEP